MKQIVIKGTENYTDLLTPYLTKEYLKRNGQEVFVYIHSFNDDNTSSYTLTTNKDDMNDFREIYSPCYLTTNLGKVLNDEEFEKIDFDKCYIDNKDIFKDRENKHLVNIAKEIDDKTFVKVIEIPDDVKYIICESDCDLDEWIQEDVPIRKWF